MRYTVGAHVVDSSTGEVISPVEPPFRDGNPYPSPPEPTVPVRLSFLHDVGVELQRLSDELDDARQPRPLEQALAILAQAWQSAVKPVEPERVAMPDVLLEAQRAGWDSHAVSGSVLPDADNPWPAETPLWRSWREGWLMAQNDEARP